MFKIQTKSYSCGKRWQDLKVFGPMFNMFSTETMAWEHVASLDQDGWIDRGNFRVIRI